MRTSSLVAVVTATIVLGLSLEASLAVYGEWLANLLVFAVFFSVLRRSGAREARQLLVCTAIAFLGEVFLCFVWGLYTYRLGSLPLFVPPGHALLFLAGSRIGPLVKSWFPGLVLAAGTVMTAGLLLFWGLEADLLWFGLFAAVFFIGKERKVYSVMLPMALLLELLGTALGTWRWAPEVPYFGLSSGNPPLAAGAFYCVLDLFVFASTRWLTRALERARSIRAGIGRRRGEGWISMAEKSTATIPIAAGDTIPPAPLGPMKNRAG